MKYPQFYSCFGFAILGKNTLLLISCGSLLTYFNALSKILTNIYYYYYNLLVTNIATITTDAVVRLKSYTNITMTNILKLTVENIFSCNVMLIQWPVS